MTGYLVTTANTVLCSHGGTGSPTLPSARIRAGGLPLVVQPLPYLVKGCPAPALSGGILPPCVSASWLTGALRVRSSGQAVLLTNSMGVTAPNGVRASIVPAQRRARGG